MNTIYAYIAVAIFSAVIVPFISWMLMRFNQIDIELQNKMDQQQVRQLLEDKFNPVKDDLVELKEKIDKIFDHLLENKNGK